MNQSFLLVAFIMLGFLLGVLLRHVHAVQELRTEQRRWVQVGDMWEFVGEQSTSIVRNKGYNRVYKVIEPNINSEAGPDSWEMRNLDGKTAYMHHGQRVVDGCWILLMRDGRPMRNKADVRRCLEAEKADLRRRELCAAELAGRGDQRSSLTIIPTT